MEFKTFVGVDVSKETLDITVIEEGKMLLERRIPNSIKAIKMFAKEIKKVSPVQPSEQVYCLEHTGIYCNHLLGYLTKEKIAVWMENPMAIKAFFGMERGKNDQVDARRIAEYVYAKRDKIRLWEPPREVVKKVKYLLTVRERLVKTRKSLTTPIQEADGFIDKDLVKVEKKITEPILDKLDAQLKTIEKQLRDLIQSDDNLRRLNDQVSSVIGVGMVVSANVIVATNEFKSISDPRKMACHCGIAPFSYQSGKTIRGKSKVSHRANKSLKTLFHLAAMSAIGTTGELRDYYLRKVEEGKNKMAVLNAVRNKIIHRIFACVDQNRKYEKNYALVLA
jgi:transposase